MAGWSEAGLGPQIGINVTSADFQKGDLCQRIMRALDKAGTPPRHLVVEITEQVFMGGRRHSVARTIQSLRDRGIRVSLDDFGTGFASLTHLLDFPVDIIKIDRSFVAGVDLQARSSVIIESLITIANRLGMTIIAEGIETEAQAARLQAMGCRYGQGFLYSPAVPACVTTQLLTRFGRRPAAPVTALTATAA
jgi:EAL domain-containing protein (putative c-di-GMP-specific phosphodiesterase class I)